MNLRDLAILEGDITKIQYITHTIGHHFVLIKLIFSNQRMIGIVWNQYYKVSSNLYFLFHRNLI